MLTLFQERIHPVGWRAYRVLLDLRLGWVVNRLPFMKDAGTYKPGEEHSVCTSLRLSLSPSFFPFLVFFIFVYSSYGALTSRLSLGIAKGLWISFLPPQITPSGTEERYYFENKLSIRFKKVVYQRCSWTTHYLLPTVNKYFRNRQVAKVWESQDKQTSAVKGSI